MKNDVSKGIENPAPENMSDKAGKSVKLGFWEGIAKVLHALKPKLFFFFYRKRTLPNGVTEETEVRVGGHH